jgi:hypothetical protein
VHRNKGLVLDVTLSENDEPSMLATDEFVLESDHPVTTPRAVDNQAG